MTKFAPSNAALVIMDVTGSTALFERAGDAVAAAEISRLISSLKNIAADHQGSFVRSKGDDLLCVFPDSHLALRAVQKMLTAHVGGKLSLHGAAHIGEFVRVDDDIYGDAVNLTARLVTVAKSGEVLVTQDFFDGLQRGDRSYFRFLDQFLFKGKKTAVTVYALATDDGDVPTQLAKRGKLHQELTRNDVILTLRFLDKTHVCKDSQSLFLGRSPDCDFIFRQPTASRKHAVLIQRQGRILLEDTSTSGTFVLLGNGKELYLHRETTILTGSGSISPSTSPRQTKGEVLYFSISR